FIVGSYMLILIVELVNTSMERMLDRLHPQSDELIGLSKDIASAAVFLSIVFSFIVVLIIALGKYSYISL
ncbi:MAG: diacylglycerol kinase, partial [Candidatus Pacebacteria bacterium]|nr:diacylglycerol kinase [Candidatus Paceibacterota bacterium]